MAELTHAVPDADRGPVGSPPSRKGAAQPTPPSLSPARSSRASDSDTAEPSFRTDPEFEALCPPLGDEERALLEAELAAHGVRESLVIWKEEGLLLDGHTRLAICRARGIPFDVVEYSFLDRNAARNWVIDNAVSRRNLTPEQRSYLLGKKYVAQKKPEGRPEKLPHREAVSGPRTSARVADDAGVSRATVERAAEFATAVDAIEATAGPETRRAILDGSVKASRRAVAAAAAKQPKSLAEFKRMVGADNVPPRTAPATRDERDHVEELNALAERTSAAMRAYCKAGARSKDRERLTELWELRAEIERLFSYLEGQK